MRILSIIGSLPCPEQPAGELTETRYAQLPFLLLSHGQAPFDGERGPGGQIPGQLAGLWRQALASYQLCAFHAVNAATRGSAFAERILGLQTRFLDGIQAGIGDEYAGEIRKLYTLASQPMSVTTRDGRQLEIPVDWRIAVDFLLTSPDSPHKTDQETFSAEGAPDFPGDVDAILAEALEQAWAKASEHFLARVQTVP
jgi:hypothetical protein